MAAVTGAERVGWGGLGGERMRGSPTSSCFQFSPDEEASSQGGCWVGVGLLVTN